MLTLHRRATPLQRRPEGWHLADAPVAAGEELLLMLPGGAVTRVTLAGTDEAPELVLALGHPVEPRFGIDVEAAGFVLSDRVAACRVTPEKYSVAVTHYPDNHAASLAVLALEAAHPRPTVTISAAGASLLRSHK